MLRSLLGEVPPPKGVWRRLQMCATPRLYGAQIAEDERPQAWGEEPTLAQAVDHYLAVGASAGLRLSVWFNPDWYAAELALRDHQVAGNVDPFCHWLTWGWDHRVVPTPLFDERFYAASHPALASAYDGWLFQHFLTRGAVQPGYHYSPAGTLHDARDAESATGSEPLLLGRLLRGAARAELARTSPLEDSVATLMHRRHSLLTPEMSTLIDRAAALEPAITKVGAAARPATLPLTWHPLDELARRAEGLRRRLPVRSCDALVLLPENADAGCERRIEMVLDALHRSQPGTRTLMLGSGAPPDIGAASEHAGTVTIDCAAELASLGTVESTALLHDVAVGLTPRLIINLDSDGGWELFATYARQLGALMSLVGWLVDPWPTTGQLEKLPQWAPFVSLVLTADPDAASALGRHFVMPRHLRRRWQPAPAGVEELTTMLAPLLGPAMDEGRR